MSGLCTSGEATATVGGTNPAGGAKGDSVEYMKRERGLIGGPPPPPDFTDNLIQEARKRQAQQLLTKSNRRDALANNPGTAAPVSYSLLK